MLKLGLSFVAGVLLSSTVKDILRPVARSSVKRGFVAKQYLEEIAAEAREDLEDLKAEAAAERAAGKPAPVAANS
jgi:hypothetical protein